MPEAEPVEDARAELLEEDVGALDQPEERRLGPGLLQVEAGAALAPVEREEERRVSPVSGGARRR